MRENTPPGRPQEKNPKRLETWKEIAAYLNREPRTVQRWEKQEGLPVHRLPHQSRDTVYAFAEELDDWVAARSHDQTDDGRMVRFGRKSLYLTGLVSGILLAAGLVAVCGRLESLRVEILRQAPVERKITTHLGHELQPCLSPASNFVAFSWDGEGGKNDDIYVEQVGTGKPLRRTSHPSTDYSPCWSPDGKRIAFLRATALGSSDVILIPPLTGPERVVAGVHPPPPDWGPQLTWSSDGNWLITSHREHSESSFGLFAIHLSSGRMKRVTKPLPDILGDYFPSQSPVSSRLSFIRSIGVNAGDIYVADLDSEMKLRGEPFRVTALNAEISSPTWTPSGKRIVFSAGSFPKAMLWTIEPARGREPELLTVAGQAVYYPRMKRSHQLVFSRLSVNVNLWEIDVPTGRLVQTAYSSSGVDHLPEYDPIGERVVFTSNRTGYPELWLKDERGAIQLTDYRASHTGDVSWYSDGTRICFDSTVSGNPDIYVLPVDLSHPDDLSLTSSGTAKVRITSHPSPDLLPSWSPDGLHIYFTSKRKGDFDIWRVSADGGSPEQVTHQGGYYSRISPDGRTLYHTKWQEEGIWKQSLETGVSDRLLDRAVQHFEVCKEGLYLLRYRPSVDHLFWIEFLDLKTGEIREIFSHSGRHAEGWSLSPDRDRILLSLYDEDAADIVMIDAFSCKRLVGMFCFPPFHIDFRAGSR